MSLTSAILESRNRRAASLNKDAINRVKNAGRTFVNTGGSNEAAMLAKQRKRFLNSPEGKKFTRRRVNMLKKNAKQGLPPPMLFGDTRVNRSKSSPSFNTGVTDGSLRGARGSTTGNAQAGRSFFGANRPQNKRRRK